MSVERKSFVNTCSLQIFCLCVTGILFASFISCIAGENTVPRVESLIEKVFSEANASDSTPVTERLNLSSQDVSSTSPKAIGSSTVSNTSLNKNSILGEIHNNTSPSSSMKAEPRSSTGKTPSLPDPNELKDASPVVDYHHPVGRKGVSLESEETEAKADVSTDFNKNNTCVCTIVASEGSDVQDCHSCNETQSPVSSVSMNSSAPQNVTPSTVGPAISSTVNVTNSLSTTNGTVTNEKAVTDPTSVNSSDNTHARNQTETQEETRKPFFTMDETEEAKRLATSSYPEGAYIIPVVAIILTVPLLIALGMILYKKAKEFWERRHYRRMDFLIDGMYND